MRVMLVRSCKRTQRLEERAKATPFARRWFGVVSFSAKIAGGDFGQ